MLITACWINDMEIVPTLCRVNSRVAGVLFSAVCDGLSAALPGCPCALQIAGLPITVSYPSVPLGTALAAVSGAGAYKHTRRPGQPLKIL